jgi:hypothetical protein
MGADQIGVGVGHLGLEPQPELHAVLAHPPHQGVQAVRPDGLVHVPVTQTRVVASAVAEPAVVDDEPLGADLGGGVGQREQPVFAVAEVDRLPGVHRHGARRPRVAVAGAQHLVEPAAQTVHPVGGMGEVHPRRTVGLALAEPYFAGFEQLTGAEHGVPFREPLDVLDMVAAPGDVDGPHFAGAESEAGGAGDERARVVPGPAAAVLPGPHALPQRGALGGAFSRPPAGAVEHLPRLGRQRHQARQPVQGVGGRRGVDQLVPDAQHALGGQLDLGPQLKPAFGVGGAYLHTTALDLGRDEESEAGRAPGTVAVP